MASSFLSTVFLKIPVGAEDTTNLKSNKDVNVYEAVNLAKWMDIKGMNIWENFTHANGE